MASIILFYLPHLWSPYRHFSFPYTRTPLFSLFRTKFKSQLKANHPSVPLTSSVGLHPTNNPKGVHINEAVEHHRTIGSDKVRVGYLLGNTCQACGIGNSAVEHHRVFLRLDSVVIALKNCGLGFRCL